MGSEPMRGDGSVGRRAARPPPPPPGDAVAPPPPPPPVAEGPRVGVPHKYNTKWKIYISENFTTKLSDFCMTLIILNIQMCQIIGKV